MNPSWNRGSRVLACLCRTMAVNPPARRPLFDQLQLLVAEPQAVLFHLELAVQSCQSVISSARPMGVRPAARSAASA
jgi:hypothetical protein